MNRKGYVYRFVDNNLKILYVGKTVDMDRRMKQHFSPKSHLAHTDLYDKIHKIEYITCKTEYDSLVKELYYINLFKPKYNTDAKIKQKIQKNDNDIWKTYKIIKPLPADCEIKSTIGDKFLLVIFVLILLYIFFVSR